MIREAITEYVFNTTRNDLICVPAAVAVGTCPIGTHGSLVRYTPDRTPKMNNAGTPVRRLTIESSSRAGLDFQLKGKAMDSQPTAPETL